MALITHRRFTYPAVLVLSTGLGLATVAGLPSPVSAAAPVIAGVPEPPDRQSQLEKALLTDRDVPAGYVKQDLGGYETMLAELLAAKDSDANPCDMVDEVSDALSDDDSASAASALSDDASATATSTLTISGPGILPADNPAPTVPVKGSPPAPDVPVTAGAFFLNEETNAVVIEALAVVGEDAALATIDQVEEVLEECPQIEIESVKVSSRPLGWNPQLGDESITGTVHVEAKFIGIEFSAKIKFAQVAYRDVALTVALVGADDPRDQQFKKLTRTAVRKLVTTSGITSRP